MAAKRTSRTDTWISLLVFIGVLIVYIVTLCPSLFPGAPLNAVTAATKTRFLTAVEYPVWRFVARIFSGIMDVVGAKNAWALNLFSAVCGAAAIGLLYRIFARFAHTRTRDELVRFRGQPNLVRFAALSAALLVAFTQSFWRASILAGTDALNIFLLVWATHLLLRYTDTRKKRYFVMYGIVYAAGMANFPTMMLLFPIYLVLSIMWCREVYADLITLGITIGAAAIVFAVAVISGPAGFASGLPAYFLSPMPVTTPLFEYLRWYWGQMRLIFPMGGLQGALSWLLWLVLPTLPPVIYLAFTKPASRPEMGRGSAISDGIFRFLSFLYTLFGIMVLLDLIIGPYPMRNLMGFLVAYAVAGGWLCYMLGYWAIIFTGKLGGGRSGSLARHAKGGYAVLVAVFLFLPVASAVKHLRFNHTSLAGFTLLEDFAKDTLRSAATASRSAADDTETPVVLFIKDGWGDLLRYVDKYGRLDGDAEDADIALVDLNAAESHHGRLIDKYDYLTQKLVGSDVPAQLDPRSDPTLSYAEVAMRYIDIGRRTRPEVPLPRVTFTSDHERLFPQSITLNAAYQFVPRGLVYLLDLRASSASLPADQLEAGHALWDTLALRALEERPPGDQAVVVRRQLGWAAKLANDFGVYCHRHESKEAAVRFYTLALAFEDQSYAALRNMQIAGEEVQDLESRLSDINMLIDGRVAQAVEGSRGSEREEQVESVRRYHRALFILYNYGLVRDPQLILDLLEGARTSQATSYARRYALYSLRVMLDPNEAVALADRGILYLAAARQNQRQRSLRQTVRALKDLQAALPGTEDPTDRAKVLYWMGEAYLLLVDPWAAEDALDQAVEADPDLSPAYNRLVSVYVATGRKAEAIALVKDRAAAQPPTSTDQVFAYLRGLRTLYLAGDEPDLDGFMIEVEAFKTAHSGQALSAGIFLVDMAVAEQDYERAHELIDELNLRYNRPSVVRLRQAQLATLEAQLADAVKHYNDVLAVEFDEDDPLSDEERVAWLSLRGNALLRLGKPVEALEQFEATHTAQQDYYQRLYDEREAQLQTDAQRRSNENQRAATIRDVQLNRSFSLWYSAVQAYEHQPDETLRQKALTYGAMHYQRTMTSDQTSEPQKLMAAARYGWTQFRVQGDAARAHDLIETTALGLSRSGAAQLYFGALLIAEDNLEQGVKRLAMADSMRDQLDNYETALLDKLIKEHEDIFEPLPEQPGASGTTTAPIDLDGDNGTTENDTILDPTDTVVDPDDDIVNPDDM